MALKLSREDNLEIQNLQLRAENIAGKMQLLQQQLNALLRDKSDIEEAMRVSAKTISAKYGFDPMKVQIEPDGTILSAVKGYQPGQPAEPEVLPMPSVDEPA